MIDLINTHGEVFGAFLICLIILALWIIQLKKDNERLLSDAKDMSAKSIEIMTQATKSMEDSGISDKALVSKIDSLREIIIKNRCHYER